MAQDSQIQSRFLAGWNTTLNTNLMFATRARKNVENSRLLLDAAKARAKGKGMFKMPGQAKSDHQDEEIASEEAKAQIEAAEDEFVGQTEEAVGVMKNVSAYISIMPGSMAIHQGTADKYTGSRHPGATPKPCRPHRSSA